MWLWATIDNEGCVLPLPRVSDISGAGTAFPFRVLVIALLGTQLATFWGKRNQDFFPRIFAYFLNSEKKKEKKATDFLWLFSLPLSLLFFFCWPTFFGGFFFFFAVFFLFFLPLISVVCGKTVWSHNRVGERKRKEGVFWKADEKKKGRKEEEKDEEEEALGLKRLYFSFFLSVLFVGKAFSKREEEGKGSDIWTRQINQPLKKKKGWDEPSEDFSFPWKDNGDLWSNNSLWHLSSSFPSSSFLGEEWFGTKKKVFSRLRSLHTHSVYRDTTERTSIMKSLPLSSSHPTFALSCLDANWRFLFPFLLDVLSSSSPSPPVSFSFPRALDSRPLARWRDGKTERVRKTGWAVSGGAKHQWIKKKV